MTMADWSDVVEKTYQRAVALEDSVEGWKTVKETEDCVIFSRPSEDFAGFMYEGDKILSICTYNTFKSVGIIPASPEVVFNMAAPSAGQPGRCQWDTSVASSVIIEQIFSDTDIRVTRTLPVCMGLISAREFVDVVKVTHEAHRIFTACMSIEHPATPAAKSKGFVRGTNYPHGLFCYRIDGHSEETRFIQYINSDLGGMLPQRLIDSATPSVLATNYKQMKAAIRREKF